MNQEFTQYEREQLTNQSECYIHTHPRENADLTMVLELQSATPVTTVSDGDTLTYAHNFVSIDPLGGVVTLNLPPTAKSKEYHITMVGTGSLTITPDGTDTIVGEPDAILYMEWTSLHIKSDNNGNWIVI